MSSIIEEIYYNETNQYVNKFKENPKYIETVKIIEEIEDKLLDMLKVENKLFIFFCD